MELHGGDTKKKTTTSSYRLYCCAKGFQTPEPKTHDVPPKPEKLTGKRKPGGWRAMPYILGNETFERLASIGLTANFMVYLTREYHMTQVNAANILNLWGGLSNFGPLLGAFISDAYVGRYKTIAFASCSTFLGMMIITLTAWLPELHPPKCNPKISPGSCETATSKHLAVLLTGLCFISIGSAGIRPCSIPFGVDQFDQKTKEGLKGVASFFNWYYATFTVVILITLTVVVYIQDTLSWVVGFGIPTLLMLCAIVLYFLGTRIYVHVKPEGSIFSGIAQVLVAAYKKRKIKLPDYDEGGIVDDKFYDPAVTKESVLAKLALTNEFRFFNKAAVIIEENEKNPDGSPANPWRLCTIQQVEEVKCLIRVIPISLSGIVALTAIVQQGTFTTSQALKMDRHLGPKFQVPAASMGIISMMTIGLWLPFYDRILVPALRKITKHEGGITLLQRIGIGIVFSILSMVAAGMVEKERRSFAVAHPKAPPMSAFWLAPQLGLMGFCEAFNIIGQIEFYNKQFPEHMRSIANALFSLSFAGANYLSSLVTILVHRFTSTSDHPDWLANDLNAGRLDYFYYLLAVMGVVNFIYYLFSANRYRYKPVPTFMEDKSYVDDDIELSSAKVSS